jgi:glutamine amidotransferase
MTQAPIVVVDYGMGNIHSIVKALRLYAPNVVFTNDAGQMADARALVLPGDGAFPAAMQNLGGELSQAILRFIAEGRPLLGVCIGFQVLFADSDEEIASGQAGAESSAVGTGRAGATLCRGLGVIPGRIRRFSFNNPQVRIPHMGWNRLLPVARSEPSAIHVTDDYMYFIHSYRAVDVPREYVLARCQYAHEEFPALVRNAAGNVLAAQFHPEKSDRAGLRMLEEWVATL